MAPPDHYDPDRPWLRQPCDTDQGWALFSDFLAMGPCRKLAKVPGYADNIDLISGMAYANAWRERARAWDLHLTETRIAEVERVIREDARAMAERHLRMTRDLADLGHSEIRRAKEIADKTDMAAIGVTPNVARRMIVDAIKLDRLITGEATERIATPDVSTLSVDELRALRDLQEKAGVAA